MSNSIPTSCCDSDNSICHLAKGSGYFVGSTIAYLAAVGVAIIVAGIAIGLFASNALFIASYALSAPIQLLWVIPVTLAFVAIDVLLIQQLAQSGASFGKALVDKGNDWSGKMIQHFQSIC